MGVGKSWLDLGINLGRNQHNTMSERQTNAGHLQPNSPYSNHEEEVMTKPQAAGFIQVSLRTIDSHMKKGWIPYIKLPSGAIRFRRSQLIAFMDTYQRVSVS
jgi:hypothetical protein